jgi:hypothetical protein
MKQDRAKSARKTRRIPRLGLKREPREKNASWMEDFRNDDAFAMRPVYAVLLTITLMGFIGTLLYAKPSLTHPRLSDFFDRFGANITTEGLGITFTLVFVDRFLEQQDRRRRLRGSIRALRRAAIALDRMINAWAPLIRGTLDADPTPPPPTMETLFAPHYTENLMALDFTRPRFPKEPEGPTWIEWAITELRSGVDVLSDVGLRYSIILDSSYIEAIDHLVDDDFIDFLDRLLERPDIDTRGWRVALNTARGHRESHFTDLVRMLQIHNNMAREAGQVRTRGAGPRTGQLGVELAPDHDLRAPWRIEREWWRTLPVARSLRMTIDPMEKQS